eukprot:TRINITY_DN16976_c0_g1_i1.p1 TRINITY_DN16976_c0_g1~~TRINITY_DN16976_c0_g1_i1.p1  ORF type:complete len:335 (+),score=24.67 TRINITY_DN16976_c0_g1_i1:462-1466(+)
MASLQEDCSTSIQAPLAPDVPITICIGDIHGHFEPLLALWTNLEEEVGQSAFETCTVLFLGDYCDRGPRTKDVYEWLVTLKARHPFQKHFFLCGNHDFAFAAFIGALPEPHEGFSEAFDWTVTWREFEPQREVQEGWWKGEGVEKMHVQGRRWGGHKLGLPGSTYSSETTFQSYGVQHGDHEGLVKAVPEHHKEFLRKTVKLIHEQEGVDTGDPKTSYSRLIAVHAGLENALPLEPQLALLRERNVMQGRCEMLSGRANVYDHVKELDDAGVLLISGHHGKLDIRGRRFVIDESGGVAGRPLAAVVLPARTIVRSVSQDISKLLKDVKQLALSR